MIEPGNMRSDFEKAISIIEGELSKLQIWREFACNESEADRSEMYGRLLALSHYTEDVMEFLHPEWGGVEDEISKRAFDDAEVKYGIEDRLLHLFWKYQNDSDEGSPS
jgi:hypothetical protein